MSDALTEYFLQFFEQFPSTDERDHVLCEQFRSLAYRLVELPHNPERAIAFRRLLEARDAAVRATWVKG